MRALFRALCAALFVLMAGCGQKGPLFLPGDSAATANDNGPAGGARQGAAATAADSSPPVPADRGGEDAPGSSVKSAAPSSPDDTP